MKNKNVLILAVASAMLVISSCSKKEDVKDPQSVIKSSTGNPVAIINMEDREEWSNSEGKCIPVTNNTCCEKPQPLPPPPAITRTVMQNLYSDFVTAYNTGTTQAYFNNSNYGMIWPELAGEVAISAGLKNGTNRIMKYTNTVNSIDYYLIGANTSTDVQIFMNPLMVIYVNW